MPPPPAVPSTSPARERKSGRGRGLRWPERSPPPSPPASTSLSPPASPGARVAPMPFSVWICRFCSFRFVRSWGTHSLCAGFYAFVLGVPASGLAVGVYRAIEGC